MKSSGWLWCGGSVISLPYFADVVLCFVAAVWCVVTGESGDTLWREGRCGLAITMHPTAARPPHSPTLSCGARDDGEQ